MPRVWVGYEGNKTFVNVEEFAKKNGVLKVVIHAIKIFILKLVSRATWLIFAGFAGLYGMYLLLLKYDGALINNMWSSLVFIVAISSCIFLILAGKNSKYTTIYVDMIKAIKNGKTNTKNRTVVETTEEEGD